MKYYKFICSNGFCGCDEEFYEEVDEKNTNLNSLAEEILFNEYSFAEPDGRFIYYDTDEERDMAEDEYRDNLEVYYEEITKEEYEENTN